jgi:plastocyanin
MSKTTKNTVSTTIAAKSATVSPAMRWALVLMLAVLAFFATYRYAIARGSVTPASASSGPVAGPGTNGTTSATSGCCGGAGSTGGATGGGCCGGTSGPAGAQTSKKATVTGAVQKITIDTSKGYYDPATVQLKAGVPAEITFTQSSGCLAQVQSSDLKFSEDLTGGPKTIKLGALAAGTYQFSCGMQMQFGSIVVK